VKQGFRPDLIEGAFNSIEFHLREQNTGSTPRGLVLMLRALAPWLYGSSPLDALEFRDRLDQLRAELLEEPGLFEKWIQKNLLENRSRVEVILSPDAELAEREQQAETERLNALKKQFAEKPAQEVFYRELEQAVKSFQETPDPPEAIASLPTLTLNDVQLAVTSPPVGEATFEDVPALLHEVSSRDILYLHLMFDLRGLEQSDLSLLPLYGRALTELGTQSMDHIRFSEQLACHTGGLEPSYFTGQHRTSGKLVAKFILRAKYGSKCRPIHADTPP
jgi:Zn-dependent M16 (insulinase) family peptidase